MKAPRHPIFCEPLLFAQYQHEDLPQPLIEIFYILQKVLIQTILLQIIQNRYY